MESNLDIRARFTPGWVVLFCVVVASPLSAAADEQDAEAQDAAEADEQQPGDDEAAGEQADEQQPGQEGPDTPAGPEVPDDEWIGDDDEEDEERLPEAQLRAPEGADEAFRAEIDAYNEAYRRYTSAVDDYQQALEDLVETEFDRRMAEIDEAFDPRIQEAELVEQQRREEAIESLEAFLEEYPEHVDHTPDALFRLAVLYDQREQNAFEEAQEEYFERVDQLEEEGGDFDELGEAPQRSFEDSRPVFERLVEQWPDYDRLDLAYYFMAHMEWEQGNWERASELSSELIRQNPDSEFVSNAWLMIGEYYFEEADKDGPDHIRDNLETALDAFQEAASERGREQLNDDNYVRAVYSWAWTHYRMEDFPRALDIFRDCVALIDRLAEETGRGRLLLREDAVGHLAEILAMEQWDMEAPHDEQPDDEELADADPDDIDDDPEQWDIGVPEHDDVMYRVEEYMSEGDDFEREVLVLVGEELFEFRRYDEAIEVYEHLLEEDPMAPDNPEIHAQIVAALHRDFREEEAFAVRREMVDYYGEESAWYEHQQRTGNEGAIRDADNMVRDYLLMAATWYHEQAQTQRNEALAAQDEAALAVAEQKYERAAEAYEEFLRNYPDDSEIFEWTYYYADTLYYAGNFEEAYEQYRVVRELDVEDNPYQETSAFNAVEALEFVMRDKVEAGELTPTALAGTDMEGARDAAEQMEEERDIDEDDALEQVHIEGEPIPAIVEDYVTAMDRYVVLGLENEDDAYLDAKFAYQAAQVFHDFQHFDESRERFAWIVENYSEHEVGYLAGTMILESYRLENDFESLAEWAGRLEGVIEGEQAEAVRAEVRQYRLQGMFNAAEDMIAEERYEEAAEQFSQLARDAEDHHLAPRALSNAGSAAELAGDYNQAIEHYEKLFTEYAEDDLAARAVFRVAVNSEWLFDYDKSVRHYELFYEQYQPPTPEALQELGFDIEERREEALLHAAEMNNFLQRYEEAAERFEQFFDTYPESEYSAETLWAAAEAWEDAGNTTEMVRMYEQFIDEFGDTPEHAQRQIEAHSRIASMHEERGQRAQADDRYEQIVEIVDDWLEQDEFPPGEGQILERAAEARFMLVEREFEEWDEVTIEGTMQQQEQALTTRLEGVEELVDQYEEVLDYGSVDWVLAGRFRIGNVMHRMAQSLFDVPNPFEEGTDEYWVYQDTLEQEAFPLEDAARENYRETVELAREHERVNEWTERALEQLHQFEPEDYPYFEDEQRPRHELIDRAEPLLNYELYEQRRETEEREEDEDLEAFDEAAGEEDEDTDGEQLDGDAEDEPEDDDS